MTTTSVHAVHGRTADGFDSVRAAFEASSAMVDAGGAAFSAYLHGELVVDLWCGQAGPDRAWEEQTVSSLFSATKGMAAACVALLHDRGLLDVDAPVATYWPEFAAARKAELTVRQLLSHTGGMIEIPGHQDFMDLDGNGWGDLPRIRERLAGATPAWEPGTAHGYHVMTFGYLAGTLVELISGRRLPQFFDESYGEPLGLDLRIGAPDAVVPRMTKLVEVDFSSPAAAALREITLLPTHDPSTLAGRACLANGAEGVLDHLEVMGNDLKALRCGGGFGDGIGTARELARFYSELVAPSAGSTGPSAATMKTFTAVQSSGPDLVLQYPMAYALGFQCNVEIMPGVLSMGPSMAAFGHGGAGGQVGMGDPENGVAVGFLRSHLALASPLAPALIAALYNVVLPN